MPSSIRPITNCPIEQWAVPNNIGVLQSERTGGCSQAPYGSFNLGSHVGDNPRHVAANREHLKQQMLGCQHLHWLNQVHSTTVLHAHREPRVIPDADASVTQKLGHACIVMTADCLPVLFCAEDGSEVAAAHAGWRGLANGVLEQTIQAMQTPMAQIRAWLGPCIGPEMFEVGAEVRQQFVAQSSDNCDAFQRSAGDRWLANLQYLAVLRLLKLGVTHISTDLRCTYQNSEQFFSYRRACQTNDVTAKGVTGRMATAIWIKAHNSKT